MLTIEQKKTIKQITSRYGAQKVFVFGSMARNENNPESDLDLLLTLKQGSSLFDLIAIKQDLEDALHCKVDVATEASLSPYFRQQVLFEAIPL